MTVPPFVAYYERAMLDGIAGSFEAEFGEPLNLIVRLEIYPTPDGIVTFSRDVSDARRAERKLVEQEKQMALAVEGAGLAAWYFDPDRRVVGGDRKMTELFGLTVSEGPAELWLAAVHPQDRDRVDQEFVAGIAGTPYDTEYRVCHQDGKRPAGFAPKLLWSPLLAKLAWSASAKTSPPASSSKRTFAAPPFASAWRNKPAKWPPGSGTLQPETASGTRVQDGPTAGHPPR